MHRYPERVSSLLHGGVRPLFLPLEIVKDTTCKRHYRLIANRLVAFLLAEDARNAHGSKDEAQQNGILHNADNRAGRALRTAVGTLQSGGGAAEDRNIYDDHNDDHQTHWRRGQ